MSGIAARCYAAGECSADSDTEALRIADAARAYTEANPSYGFDGDARSAPNAAQYYGYAVYAARW